MASNSYGQRTDDTEIVLKSYEVEKQPVYKGGIGEFDKYMNANFRIDAEKGYEGKMILELIVEKDGSLSNIAIIRDFGYGTSRETLRCLEACPKWEAGEKNGKTVRTLCMVSIDIKDNR
ncbi:energy transducer TonB [Flavobacterium sp. ZT3R18]|uniref:energy transducer TonB n=1 Tax=Flavobacterium sp. ZT3R18 TaxID=2594429 RepID=UPI00163D9A59|nr:energy transducer TonB [Flavobacterium sp. ZT3R18]